MTHVHRSFAIVLLLAPAIVLSSASCADSHRLGSFTPSAARGVPDYERPPSSFGTGCREAGVGRCDVDASWRPPPPPPDRTDRGAWFTNACGPDDGAALRLVSAGVPLSCGERAGGEDGDTYFELYFQSLPRTDVGTFFLGDAYIPHAGTPSVVIHRCSVSRGVCDEAKGGSATVGVYVPESRVSVVWTATFVAADLTETHFDGIAEASYCPSDVHCG